MAQHSLGDLYRRFLRETTLIIGRFEAPPSGSAPVVTVEQIHRDCREMCVLRLHDSWARFCRELIILSAGCRPVTLTGFPVPLAPHIRGRSDVLPMLRSLYPGRRRRRHAWEPRWHVAAECLDAARLLNIANFADVSAGIGLTPSPVDQLRQMRNFLAHRGADTAPHVRRIAQAVGRHRSTKVDIILGQHTHPGITIFAKWAYNLHDMARTAVG